MDTVGLHKDQVALGNGVRLPIDLNDHVPFQHQHHFVASVHMERKAVVGVSLIEKMIRPDAMFDLIEKHTHGESSDFM
jgi:hypothetical protein